MRGMGILRTVLTAVVVLWLVPTRAATYQGPASCDQATKYEEARFGVSIKPLKLANVRGRAVIEDPFGHIRRGEIPRGVCLSLFLADSHKFVSSTTADDKGNFDFGPVEPGRYRLVARAEALCTGNIPVVVARSARKARHRGMVLLFRLAQLDVCTSADYAR